MARRETRPVVVVAGGGYAGALAANRVAGKLGKRARVVLVTPGDTLTDRIRLHEAAARGTCVERPLARLLHPAIQRVDARVVGLDPHARELAVAHDGLERSLRYDWLVLALGSRPVATIPTIPSTAPTAPHALALADSAAAHALFRKLRTLERGARVAVVGGGLTAIELSSELAEAHPHLQVELIGSELAPGVGEVAQHRLRRALETCGVHVHLGQRVAALDSDGVRFVDGSRREAAVSVLASGFAPTALGERFLLPTDAQGRVPVDAELRVRGFDDVLAVGDLAAPPASSIGRGLNATGMGTTRMGCASAMPQGAHAADQIVRAMTGRPLSPFRFSYAMQCLSVGRRQGIVAFVDADDRPTGRVLSGRPGAFVKELVCRFVVAAIRWERSLAGLYTWPGYPWLGQPRQGQPRLGKRGRETSA